MGSLPRSSRPRPARCWTSWWLGVRRAGRVGRVPTCRRSIESAPHSRPGTSSTTPAVAGDRLPRHVGGHEAACRGDRVAGADDVPPVGAGSRRRRVVVAARRTALRGRSPSGRRQGGGRRRAGHLTLVDLTRGDLLTAGALPGRLRSDDAVHLAVALRVGVDAILTYDSALAA